MSQISFPCTQCGRRHDFETELAGTWVFCEACETAFQVPVPRHLASSPPKPGNVKFPCDFCNQRYEVSIERVGRRFNCRKCGATLIVPGAVAPVIPAPIVHPATASRLPGASRSSGPIESPRASQIPESMQAPGTSHLSGASPSHGVYRPPSPPPPVMPEEAPLAVAYSPAPPRNPAAPSPPPTAPLAFLDEPISVRPKPGPRDHDEDGLAPVMEPLVLPRRIGPSRAKSTSSRSTGRGLAIGGGVGSILLTVVGVMTKIAISTTLFSSSPFASNESKVRATLNETITYLKGFGDDLAGARDAGGVSRIIPKVHQFLPKLMEFDGKMKSYIGLKVSKGFEEGAEAEYKPKFDAAFNRLVRERDRILAIQDAPAEFRSLFGQFAAQPMIGSQGFGFASIQPPPMPHFTMPPPPQPPVFQRPEPPQFQPPAMPQFQQPHFQPPQMPQMPHHQMPTMPHFRRHGG